MKVGFVSTRLAGTDGVSLETTRWANIITRFGLDCYYFAGESDRPNDRSCVVPEAHFAHPAIRSLSADLFDHHTGSVETSRQTRLLTDHLKVHLYKFLSAFDLNLVIAESACRCP